VGGTRVSDPHPFHADPDPVFEKIADPDPGFEIIENPDPGLDFLNICVFCVK